VTGRLVAAGVPVQAIANPLRGITADAAYVVGVIWQTSNVADWSTSPRSRRQAFSAKASAAL
jgi:hypothetical protein